MRRRGSNRRILSTSWAPCLLSGVVLASGGCGDGISDPSDELTLEPASALERRGLAGERLLRPVGVRVLNGVGDRVSGATLEFRVASGGGTVLPSTATTDAFGHGEVEWTLGPADGEEQRLDVSLSGGRAESLNGPTTSPGPRLETLESRRGRRPVAAGCRW